jgi:DNA modification methylase
MCPLRVCRECGKPSERIVGEAEYVNDDGTKRDELDETWRHGRVGLLGDALGKVGHLTRNAETLGWSDCGHGDNWRTGVVLDSFCGSGTTLEAAQAVGRHAIGIDLDHRNADLAQQRVGLFLEIDGGADAVA